MAPWGKKNPAPKGKGTGKDQHGNPIVSKPTEPVHEMHLAARNGDLPEMKRLLAEGVVSDVNDSGLNGSTPLHVAAAANHVHVMEWLIDSGADIDAQNLGRLWTPLHYAAMSGWLEPTKLLLERGASPIGKLKTQGKNYQEINKVPPQFRLTPSMLARLNENNDWEAVAELVEKESGETPDQSAAKLKAFGKTKSKK